jgi:hypothetical protein
MMVIEAQSLIAELLSKHPVLLAKVVNDLQLAVIRPPGNGDQQKAEWVEHSLGFQSLLAHLRADGEPLANSCRSNFRTNTGSVLGSQCRRWTGGISQITVMVRPGKSPEEVEALISEEVAKFLSEPHTRQTKSRRAR